MVGGQWAVAAGVGPVQVGVRFDLDHPVGAGAAKKVELKRLHLQILHFYEHLPTNWCHVYSAK